MRQHDAPAPLDVFTCEIGGTRLIEASAGTGKTWNLCGLYLRLLLEHALDVQQILVVTFTNAATAELRERIRKRIVETLACLRGAPPGDDDRFVPTLLATLRARSLDDDAMASRLDVALQTFDEAAIFTIHGFCQRALADTPFAAQLPLALEALADDADLVAEAANDFWRREVAGAAAPALAAHLAERKDSPAAFARLLARRMAKPLATLRWPRALDAATAVDAAALQAAHDAARALWQVERDAIVQCLRDGRGQLNGNTFSEAAIATAAQGWDAVLASAHAWVESPEKIDLFGSAKHKPNKGCTAPRHAFFDAAQRLLDLRATASTSLALQRLALLRRLQDDGSAALREAKRRQRVVAFDDMLFNLYERLAGGAGAGAGLAESLRGRFPAALIDEFQDTDPLQFAIFDAVYGGTALPLFLVGDPKQAIYSFRNADLHTYLRARDKAAARYTLADNQRSSRPLIDALNGLFGANGAAFIQPGLAYHAVGFGDKKRKPLRDDTAAPRAPLQVWLLPDGAATLAKRDAADAAIASCAAEIARLVVAGLRGEIRLGDATLRAGDIAVLVRTNAHGSAVRRALARLGVGSVELSRASVFDSSDAEELSRILAAILEPQREPLLRAALATELLGLDASALVALGDDEAAWSACVERFAGYRQTWLARGIGTLLRELMHAEGLPARLLARSDGERRLTNCLHLAECLHEAGEMHASPDALLRWFDTQRERGGAGGDAAQLRLESDQNLVQIVTVHRAKGLEYAFVFCPLLWDGTFGGPPRTDNKRDGVEYHDDDGSGVIDFRRGLDDAFDEDAIKRRRHLESAAEELRLLYVALTRAMHRCTLVAGGYTTHGGKTTRRRPRVEPAELARRRRGRRAGDLAARHARRRRHRGGVAGAGAQRRRRCDRRCAAAGAAAQRGARTRRSRPSASLRWRRRAPSAAPGASAATARSPSARRTRRRLPTTTCARSRRPTRRPRRTMARPQRTPTRRPPPTTSCASRAARRRALRCMRCSSMPTSPTRRAGLRPSLPRSTRCAAAATPARPRAATRRCSAACSATCSRRRCRWARPRRCSWPAWRARDAWSSSSSTCRWRASTRRRSTACSASSGWPRRGSTSRRCAAT